MQFKAYARVGLMGNPSDGFYGKTIAVTVRSAAMDAWLCVRVACVLMRAFVCVFVRGFVCVVYMCAICVPV